MRGSILVSGVVAGSLISGAANAGAYDNMYVFGDSLSDRGNLASIAGQFPNPPSYQDSFTNGPVSAERLALALGVTADASLWLTGPAMPAGTNYAVAGATAAATADGGLLPFINLPQQVATFSAYSGGAADPNALYYIDIGGNDVRDAVISFGDNTNAGGAAITAGVNAEMAAIETLVGEGARDFLIVNVPNVGDIPEFGPSTSTDAINATTYSQNYNFQLAADLAVFEAGGLPARTNLDTFDLYSYSANILANAASYGITNTTDACYTNTPYSAETSAACGPGAENIGSFAYWDDVHPTWKVQALWAQGMGDVLGVTVPVPEPATWTMLLSGMAALGFVGRARRRSQLAANG